MQTTVYHLSRNGELLDDETYTSAKEAIGRARKLWLRDGSRLDSIGPRWEVFAFRDYSADDTTRVRDRLYFWLEWRLGILEAR